MPGGFEVAGEQLNVGAADSEQAQLPLAPQAVNWRRSRA